MYHSPTHPIAHQHQWPWLLKCLCSASFCLLDNISWHLSKYNEDVITLCKTKAKKLLTICTCSLWHTSMESLIRILHCNIHKSIQTKSMSLTYPLAHKLWVERHYHVPLPSFLIMFVIFGSIDLCVFFQLHYTVCARIFWQIQFIFLLKGLWNEPST